MFIQFISLFVGFPWVNRLLRLDISWESHLYSYHEWRDCHSSPHTDTGVTESRLSVDDCCRPHIPVYRLPNVTATSINQWEWIHCTVLSVCIYYSWIKNPAPSSMLCIPLTLVLDRCVSLPGVDHAVIRISSQLIQINFKINAYPFTFILFQLNLSYS